MLYLLPDLALNQRAMFIKQIIYVLLSSSFLYGFLNDVYSMKHVYAVSLYMIADILLFKLRNDSLFHHLISLTLFSFIHVYNIQQTNQPFFNAFMKILYEAEMSSVFLGLRSFFRSSLNDMCFVLSFFYFRIFKLTKHFYFDSILTTSFSKSIDAPWGRYALLIIGSGFVGLNYYWGFYILKKVLSKRVKG